MHLPPGSYRPHAWYCAPAKPRVELWRTMFGAVMIVALYLASLLALMTYIRAHYGDLIGSAIYMSMMRGASPGALILLFFSFLGMIVAVFATTRALHGRRAGSLFGAPGQAISDFWKVAVAITALNLVILAFALMSDDPARNLDLATFVTFLPFALIGILLQSTAEELVFRGYLQQQLGARFKSPLMWMGLPAAIFAYAHYAPDAYGQNALLILVWAGLFAVLAADLTARTGTLGAAIGFHFANNLAAFLLVGIDGDMNGLSLWTQAANLADQHVMVPLLAVDLLAMVTAWLLARLVLRL